ncbi:hypothetical protein [Clostridium sp.]|uniref:hypothetical protein n=1 Tax=Clostridium sp. TaxID=1506 RepID=UPI0025C19EEF|nr:hypothetical protein [Clostridium sp.]
MYKKRGDSIKRLVLKVFYIIIVSSILIGCRSVEENKREDGVEVEPIIPKVSLDENIGSDMIQLDYASENRIIFHGHFGLFLYDLNDKKIIRNIDLESNNINYNQGDNYCDVSVSKDGNIVKLHNISSEEMYVYNIEENSLIKCDYRAVDNEYEFELIPLEIKEETYWYIN